MITLHNDRHANTYTYRQGNHIGRIFTAHTQDDFLDALNVFMRDIGKTPYPMTDTTSVLSSQSATFISNR